MVATHPRVVVVGAGLAGLRCANVLTRSGYFDVVVLECASRIGGRAWTVERLDDGGGLIEAGATYVHGTGGNPLVKLSALRNCAYRAEGRRSLRYGNGDEFPDGATFLAAWTWASNALASCGGVTPEDTEERYAREASVGEAVRELAHKVAHHEGKGADDGALFLEVVEHRLDFERVSVGDDVDGASLEAWGEYHERVGRAREPASGFGGVAEAVRGPTAVTLKSRASRIRRSPTGVTVDLADGGGEVAGDYCVVTASLGALKRGAIAFEPPLSRDNVDHTLLGFGTVNKVAVSWRRPWWRDLDDQRGEWDCVWRASDGAALPEEAKWLRGVAKWKHEPQHRGPPVVLGWVAGEKENAQFEALDDEALRRAAAGHVARLAGLRPGDAAFDDVVSGARLALRTRWGGPPHFGSYSFVPTGAGGIEFDHFAKPLDRLRFAGEHTHRTRYSTADGALLSGDREAWRLLADVDAPFSCAVVYRDAAADLETPPVGIGLGCDVLAEARGADAAAAKNSLTCYGGKRERGESSLECLARELKEELDWVPHFLPEKPTCSLIVNGLLVAHFYATKCSLMDRKSFKLEDGRDQTWTTRNDDRWSPWHAAVLDAIHEDQHLAFFDDGDAAKTLAMLRGLPTAPDLEHAHARAEALPFRPPPPPPRAEPGGPGFKGFGPAVW